jgi:hypothetical protein
VYNRGMKQFKVTYEDGTSQIFDSSAQAWSEFARCENSNIAEIYSPDFYGQIDRDNLFDDYDNEEDWEAFDLDNECAEGY